MHFLLTAAHGSPAHWFPLSIMYNVPQIPAGKHAGTSYSMKTITRRAITNSGRVYKLCDVGIVTEFL